MDTRLLYLPTGMAAITNSREVQMHARIFKNAVAAAAIMTMSILISGCGTDVSTAPSSSSNGSCSAVAGGTTPHWELMKLNPQIIE